MFWEDAARLADALGPAARRDLLRVLTSPSEVRADVIRQLHERPQGQEMAVMARFDYAFDPNAAGAVEELTGVDASNVVALIDANEAAIEAAGVVQHSYTAPGEEHGVVEYDEFNEPEVNGVRLVDWVEALLASEPLDDVHCDECSAD